MEKIIASVTVDGAFPPDFNLLAIEAHRENGDSFVIELAPMRVDSSSGGRHPESAMIEFRQWLGDNVELVTDNLGRLFLNYYFKVFGMASPRFSVNGGEGSEVV